MFPFAPRPKSVIFEPFSVIRSFLTNFNVQYGYGKLLTYRLRQFCPFWKISKNEQPTPKGSKIKLLSLDAKGNKNRKIWNKHPKTFWHIFQGKKGLLKSHQLKYRLWAWAVPSGSTLYCVRTCTYIKNTCVGAKKNKKTWICENFQAFSRYLYPIFFIYLSLLEDKIGFILGEWFRP